MYLLLYSMMLQIQKAAKMFFLLFSILVSQILNICIYLIILKVKYADKNMIKYKKIIRNISLLSLLEDFISSYFKNVGSVVIQQKLIAILFQNFIQVCVVIDWREKWAIFFTLLICPYAIFTQWLLKKIFQISISFNDHHV